MITADFLGELGNNLFQLATVISLSERHNVPFTVVEDRNCYVSIKDRPVEIRTMFDYEYTFSSKLGDTFTIYRAPDTAGIFEYTPIELNLSTDTAIQGYFQSEKYFKDIKGKLITEYFKPKQIHLDYIKEKYGTLLAQNTLAIHIRVGGDRALLQHSHKNVSLDYYTTAINTVLEKDPTVEQYVIFSDNIKYCTEIFGNSENITYIKDEINYIDLFLMSMCTHNIIANSTFSWWSAYLNNNPNQIVVAPKTEWFGPAFAHYNLKDLFLQNWITL